MSCSRARPSSRYIELQQMYRQLHEEGEAHMGLPAEETFNGLSLLHQLARIKALVERTGANTILDYGCGKGRQYDLSPIKAADGSEHENVVDYWDVAAVHCYDPCFVPFSKLPEGRFDGVVSTDVLEHCPEQDIPWIIDEIFGYAERFVYANVACYPARKRLPNGENAHCTIKPSAWWEEILQQAAAKHPTVIWQVWIQSEVDTANGRQIREQMIGQA